MDEILQITISKREAPKTKLGRWFYWRVWFKIWGIWRPKFLSWFFGLFLSKETKRKLYDDLEIHIINEINDEKEKKAN